LHHAVAHLRARADASEYASSWGYGAQLRRHDHKDGAAAPAFRISGEAEAE